MIVRRRAQEIVSAPFRVLRNLYTYRHMLFHMVRNEIKGRFAGSMGGFLWNFVHPILMLLVYLFVFVYIFKVRLAGGGGAGGSVIYLMSGLFPWMIIAEGLMRGTSSIIENATLIQKTSFPTEVVLAKAVLVPLFSYGIALVLLALYEVALTGSFQIILILPLLILVQIMFTLGIASLTATLSVFFRDVLQLVQILVNFWIYLTPILYPVAMLPSWVHKLMYLNPLFPLISIYQSVFIRGTFVSWYVFTMMLAWTIFFFVSGAFVFSKLKYEFADWL